jgi:hypothetical protein
MWYVWSIDFGGKPRRLPGGGMADKVTDILISPIASMIAAVGESVAEAQTALTAAQLEAMRDLPEELRTLGIVPTLYTMQEVSVELKIALHLEEKTGAVGGGRKARLFAAPMNAKYQNTLAYSVEGSSRLTLTFAPSPPPIALQPDSTTPDADG